MTTGKIISIIFSVILIAALAFAITWGIINWSKVEEGMKGNGLYTQEDIENAYQDGYNTALTDRDEYDDLISEYRDTITTLTDTISQLKGEIADLTKNSSALELQITNLTQKKETLEEEVEGLRSELKQQIENSKLDKENDGIIIDELKSEINSLENEILTLETQIEVLKLQQQNHSSIVSGLYKTIADLQASIEFYEQYIATLESSDTVVATFEFDGKVYSIQVIAKGSTVTIADPPSTESVIFNGWTVDGQPVTLSQYPVNSNTKFVADVSYKYFVNFTVDGVIKSTQLIDKGQYVETPTNPKKANYTFKYWTLDGINEVQLDKYPINCDTTFTAKFAKLYTVTFQYEDGTEVVSRRIEEGTTTTPARIPDLPDGAVLNGWKLNGYFVDVASHVINQDTVFVADISYLVTFTYGETTYTTQQVHSGSCATLPATPILTSYLFDYWTLDGTNEIDVETYVITNNTTFIARLFTYTWTEIKWTGLTDFYASDVWTDGVETYYSNGTSHFVLNSATRTWSKMTWKGLSSFYGYYVWTDGTDYYYSNHYEQYILDVTTHTWSAMNWNGLTSFNGNDVWTDGVNIYYSGSLSHSDYVLNVSTHTWSVIEWDGLCPTNGYQVWTDGVNTYFSDYGNRRQYVLNKESRSWTEMEWNIVIGGPCVWTDGTYYFFSQYGKHAILDVTTHTWLDFTWNISFGDGNYIWTDGNTCYYTNAKSHYMMVKSYV